MQQFKIFNIIVRSNKPLKMMSSELSKESQMSIEIVLYVNSLNSLHKGMVKWIAT